MSENKIMLAVTAGVLTVLTVIAIATGHGVAIFGIVGMLALMAMYLLPTIVAGQRNTALTPAAIIVNLFLGWTFIGWVVALALAVSGSRVVK
jgi:hypothetical protein